MLKGTTKPLRRRVLIEEGLAKSSKKKHSENTDKWHLCKAGSFSYGMVNHRGPLPLKELHSTGETIVWRDPGGSWACLPPVYHLGNANLNKTRKRAGYKVYEKTHQRKHSELKEPDGTLTLTITVRQKKAKEKALKKSIQTGKEPYRNQSEKNKC